MDPSLNNPFGTRPNIPTQPNAPVQPIMPVQPNSTIPPNPAMQPIVSSTPNNIVMPPAPATKSQKPLIITLIIIILSAIIGFGVWWYLSRNSTNNNATTIKSRILDTISFIEKGDTNVDYQYAEDSELSNVTVAVRMSESEYADQISAYYQQLNQKISQLKEENVKDDDLAKIISELSAMAMTLYRSIDYSENKKLDQEYYNQNGYEKTKQHIEEARYTNTGLIFKEFSNQYITFYANTLLRYHLYKSNGCVFGTDNFDYECAESKDIFTEAEECYGVALSSLSYIIDSESLKLFNYELTNQMNNIKTRLQNL